MMNIIMRKPTQFRSKFYSRAKPYTVTDEVGKRWIQRKIAVLDTREEFLTPLPTQEGFKSDIPDTVLGNEEPGDFEEDNTDLETGSAAAENNGTPNIKELKLIAKSQGIKGYSRMSKDKLTEALNGNNDVS